MINPLTARNVINANEDMNGGYGGLILLNRRGMKKFSDYVVILLAQLRRVMSLALDRICFALRSWRIHWKGNSHSRHLRRWWNFLAGIMVY